MKNGYQEYPILGIDMVSAVLVAAGSKMYRKGNIKILFTPNELHSDGLWNHLSMSHPNRYPTWDEILDARYTFFGEEEEVFQMLPPKSEYLNISKNCFHLWSPIGRRLMPKY